MGEHDGGIDGLAVAVVEAAQLSSTWIATAESCTGGLIAHMLTRIAGVSSVYRGGVVAYANEIKRDLLGVDPAVLAAHGAVSQQVACAMATGACARLSASYSVATTGIAGPGGSTASKPVGLVYIAAASPDALRCEEFHFSGTRAEIIVQAASEALRLLLEVLSTSTH